MMKPIELGGDPVCDAVDPRECTACQYLARLTAEQHSAVAKVLATLRNPLMLMSIPDREDALAAARKYEITAEDLIEWLLVAAYRKLYASDHKYWSCECGACEFVAWAHHTLPAYAWTNPPTER